MSRKRIEATLVAVATGEQVLLTVPVPTENFKVKHIKVKSPVAKEYKQLSKDIAAKVANIRASNAAKLAMNKKQPWSTGGVNKMFNKLLETAE